MNSPQPGNDRSESRSTGDNEAGFTAAANYAALSPEVGTDQAIYEVGDFDTDEALAAVEGQPAVELGGPTPTGYDIIENRLPANLLISNLRPQEVSPDQRFELMDAADTGLPDASHGMVLASGLMIANPNQIQKFPGGPKPSIRAHAEYEIESIEEWKAGPQTNLHIGAIVEASRVLVDGGLLVMRGLIYDDFDVAARAHLTLGSYMYRPGVSGPDEVLYYDAVFQRQPRVTGKPA